ncbi:MAG: hypothetical protein ACTSX9_00630 [Candidatus Njordarchaeales archaeon]
MQEDNYVIVYSLEDIKEDAMANINELEDFLRNVTGGKFKHYIDTDLLLYIIVMPVGDNFEETIKKVDSIVKEWFKRKNMKVTKILFSKLSYEDAVKSKPLNEIFIIKIINRYVKKLIKLLNLLRERHDSVLLSGRAKNLIAELVGYDASKKETERLFSKCKMLVNSVKDLCAILKEDTPIKVLLISNLRRDLEGILNLLMRFFDIPSQKGIESLRKLEQLGFLKIRERKIALTDKGLKLSRIIFEIMGELESIRFLNSKGPFQDFLKRIRSISDRIIVDRKGKLERFLPEKIFLSILTSGASLDVAAKITDYIIEDLKSETILSKTEVVAQVPLYLNIYYPKGDIAERFELLINPKDKVLIEVGSGKYALLSREVLGQLLLNRYFRKVLELGLTVPRSVISSLTNDLYSTITDLAKYLCKYWFIKHEVKIEKNIVDNLMNIFIKEFFGNRLGKVLMNKNIKKKDLLIIAREELLIAREIFKQALSKRTLSMDDLPEILEGFTRCLNGICLCLGLLPHNNPIANASLIMHTTEKIRKKDVKPLLMLRSESLRKMKETSRQIMQQIVKLQMRFSILGAESEHVLLNLVKAGDRLCEALKAEIKEEVT